jgi:hypothetical protein
MEGRVEELRAEFERSVRRTAELAAAVDRAEGRAPEGVPHYLEIELRAHEIGREVSRRAQEIAMAEVAATAPSRAKCPICGRLHDVGVSRRTVTSVDGPVEQVEPVGHCCRTDFFPSA